MKKSQNENIYGLIINSQIPKGNITSITLPEIPEDYVAIYAEDIPGENAFTFYGEKIPYLTKSKISFKGQPILIIGGPDKNKLINFGKNIIIKYKNKTPVLEINREKPNIIITATQGNYEKALKNAHEIIEDEYTIYGQNSKNINIPKISAKWINKTTLTIICPTQDIFNVRDNTARLLALQNKRIHIVSDNTQSCINSGIIYPSLVTGYAALLALKTKKSVKMIINDKEKIIRWKKRYTSFIDYKTVIDNKGKLTGIKADIHMDLGAFPVLSPISLKKSIIAACGGYACKNIIINSCYHKTNKIPSDYCSEFGTPQIFLALEQHTTRIARIAKTDPFIWKKLNITKPGEALINGQQIVPIDNPLRVLEDVVARSDFNRKYASFEVNNKRKTKHSTIIPVKGIGLSICFHGIGSLNYIPDMPNPSVKLKFGLNKKLSIFTSITNKNQNRFLSALSSTILNIPESDIIIEQADTSKVPDSGPLFGKQTAWIAAKLIEQGCKTIYQKRLKSELPIEIKKIHKPESESSWKHTDLNTNPFSDLCWEATVVEIEIDPVLLKPEIRGIWTSIDTGREFYPGQHSIYCESSSLQNLIYSSMKENKQHNELEEDKIIFPSPAFINIPKYKINLMDTNSPIGPGGIKGIGEHPLQGVAPAYISAISHAIGYHINEIPFVPEDLEKLLQEKENDKNIFSS